jgi:hypothetical protein
LDILFARPNVAQEHGLSFPIMPQRFGFEIDCDPSRQRKRDDERR